MLEIIHRRRDKAKVSKSKINWSNSFNIPNLIDSNSGCREEGMCIGQERNYAVYKLDISENTVKNYYFYQSDSGICWRLNKRCCGGGIHDTLNQKVQEISIGADGLRITLECGPHFL